MANRRVGQEVSGLIVAYYLIALSIPTAKTACTTNTPLTATATPATFQSTNYPTNYDINEDCGWILSAGGGFALEITISSLTIDQGGGDYYEVYDGNGPSGNLLIRTKAQNSQINIRSRSNQIFFHFVSDGSTVAEGFSVSYRQVSGTGLISGYVQNLNYKIAPFMPGDSNVWALNALPANIFVLGLYIDRNNEENCIRIKIMSSAGAQTLYDSADGLRDHAFQTTSNDFSVEFNVGCSFPTTSTGFQLTFVEQSSGLSACSGLQQAITGLAFGNLQIPPLNSGGFYNRLDDCFWTIAVNPGHSIRLTIASTIMPFGMNSANLTLSDTLYIYDGPSLSSRLIFQTNASYSTAQFTTLSSSTILHFVANDDLSVGTGFSVTFEDIPWITTSFSGNIFSTIDTMTQHYLSNQDCGWTLTARPGHNFEYNFIVAGLENGHDYVYLFDGILGASPPTLLQSDDSWSPFGQQSRTLSTSLSVLFHADKYAEFDGWSINFQETIPGCMINTSLAVTTSPGIFTSNNYPSSYRNYENCGWILTTSPGDAIEIIISSLTIDQGRGDYYEVFDVNGTISNLLIQTYAQNSQIKITSRSNQIFFHFVSDGAIVGAGFNVSYRQVPSTGLISGYVQNLNYKLSPLGPNEQIDWQVLALRGNIFLIGLNIDRSNEYNCVDSLQLLSGPAFIYFSSNGLRDHAFQTSYTDINIHFYSSCSAAVKGTGIQVTFMEQRSPMPTCSGLMQSINSSMNGTFQIPPLNVGGYYNRLDNCSWVISVNPGYSISLTLVSTIMPFYPTFPAMASPPDTLYIYDGPDMQSRLIFQLYASYSTATIVTTSNFVLLHFVANNDVSVGAGYQVSYRQVPLASAVYGSIGSAVDPITGHYQSNQDCGWKVTTDPGQQIEFSVYNRANSSVPIANFDEIKLLDGDFTSTQTIYRIDTQSTTSRQGRTNSSSFTAKFHADDYAEFQGWTIHFNETTASCIPRCVNGHCISTNTCNCWSGWTESICQTPICTSGCGNGNCTGPNVCTCSAGWTGATCNKAMCSQNCSNGGLCIAPDTCSCATGWTGYNCSKPTCSPSCQNGGTCAAPNTCSCATGYNGTACQFAICIIPCLNGGNCSSPDVCSCPSGSNGTYCEIPICNQGCANGGNCTAPSTCSCTANWTGSGCNIPVCNPSCQNGGTCTSPNNCTCTSGANGIVCENVLCNPLCKNGGTCIGNNVCQCSSGWTGPICETVLSGVSALISIANISDANFVNNVDSVKEAVESTQLGITGNNLTTPEIKAIISDVTSPDKINTLVKDIISNPFFDPPVEIYSEEQLGEQADVLSTLNQVTQRMVQLAGTLSTEQLTSLTNVLAKAADKAASLAVKGALAVQSAIIKSDRLTEQPKLLCTPLITEKEIPSLKEASTISKLDTLNRNFADFIDGITQASFHMPFPFGESKVVSGDFYSITIHKTLLIGLSGLSLRSNLGGIVFPSFATNEVNFVVYKQFLPSLPQLQLSTVVLLELITHVSNVMNSTSPYNFPTVTIRLFTTTGVELEWVGKTPIQITSQPPDSYRKQYATEQKQSQCDPHKVQCDITTNADAIGRLATFPIPTNAGDFLVDISGDPTIPFDVFILFNEIPTLSKYSWIVSVVNYHYTTSGNDSLPALRITYEKSGRLRIIISQLAISLITGQPATRVVDSTPPLFVNVLIRKNFVAFSKVDDLPETACEMLKCEGFNLRIDRLEPTRYYGRLRRRRASEDEIEDLKIETNSSTTAISFHAKTFGTFTADFLVAPNTIDFAYVNDNFDSLIATNWIVPATLAFALCLFGVILVPMYIFDKEDLREWAFLPIASNSAHEKMRYLISVHCNGCKSYQLKPKVYIRLFGDVTCTEWRLLHDGIRENFTAAKPSNFILTTYHSVGLLESIEIGVSSNSLPEKGQYPLELDIDRVIIVDVSKGRKYVFACRSKLSDAKQSKMFKLPTEDDLKCFDYLLTKNYRQLLNDAHLWRSLFRRPIASNWTRCERLTCIFVALFLAMLSNAMFFGKAPSSPRTGLNVGGLFRISWFTFVSSLISCCIVVPLTSLIAFIFQFVKRRSAENSEWETIFKIKVENVNDLFINRDVSKKRIRRLNLPYWCLYIGWILVFVCIGVSIVFIMYYSLQWGKDKSLQWLSSLFIELLQDLIVIQTAKVMVLAVIRAGRLTLPNDGLDVGLLTFAKENSTRRIGLFRKLRAIATGLGHHAAYVVAFAMVVSATTNPYAYNQVTALKPHLFVDQFKPITDTLPTFNVIFDHLLFRIIPNFLNGNQVKYGLNFENADFYKVPNHDVVIIGPIRVRQIRSAQIPCPVQSSVVPAYIGKYSGPLANNTHCSKTAQGFDAFGDVFERRNFNSSWYTPLNWIEIKNMTEFQQAWLYRETNGPSYTGELDTYGSFGYYVDLPSKLKSALRVVAQLRKMRWLDNNTTAVFTDFNLYNPQTNVFSVIKIVFEGLQTGGMIYQVRRYPLKLYQYTGSGAMFTIIVQAVWIIILVSQIVKLIYQIRKEGFKKFRSNQWNLLNLVNLAVGVVILGFFSARIYVTNAVLNSLLNPEQFTSLDALSTWEELTFGLYGLGFFLAMVGFFQYLETNKYWAIVLATLSKGKIDMLSYSIFYFTAAAIFAAYMYLLVGPVMPAFSSYKQAFSTLFQRVIGWPAMTKLGFPDKFSAICSTMYSGCILLLGGQVFIIIISTIYGQISRNVETETDWDAELAEYLALEWQRIATHNADRKDDDEANKTNEVTVENHGENKDFKHEEVPMEDKLRLTTAINLEERRYDTVDGDGVGREKKTMETNDPKVSVDEDFDGDTKPIDDGSRGRAMLERQKRRGFVRVKDFVDEQGPSNYALSIRSSYMMRPSTNEPITTASRPGGRSSYFNRRARTSILLSQHQLLPVHLEEENTDL